MNRRRNRIFNEIIELVSPRSFVELSRCENSHHNWPLKIFFCTYFVHAYGKRACNKNGADNSVARHRRVVKYRRKGWPVGDAIECQNGIYIYIYLKNFHDTVFSSTEETKRGVVLFISRRSSRYISPGKIKIYA